MKAAILLRVSTDRQAKRHREDEESLPAQRAATRRFCVDRGWEIVQEYAEEGVSAWQHLSSERSVLQDVLAAAKARLFDVLVVFKYDRLSRRSLEYPLLLASLARAGVPVWSVADDGSGRELRIEGQMDKLLRFVEGWQAETESYNTSVRVSARMRQLAEQGVWTGGRPPYGFRLKDGGRRRSGGALSLEIDPDEAAVVRLIFHLYLDEELGSPSIARWLNAHGYRLRSGKEWDDTRVRAVLTNPTVAGRPPYGRHYRDPHTHQWRQRPKDSPEIIQPLKPVDAWVIVDWDRFQQAQARLAAWHPRRQYPDAERRVKGSPAPLLLVGIARCGYCHGPLTTGYAMPVKKVGGRRVQYRYARYQDRQRTGGLRCPGQLSYSVRRLDAAVLAAVRTVLEQLDTTAVYQAVRERIRQNTFARTERLRLARAREAKAAQLVAEWTRRLDAYLLHPNDSLYSEAFLAAHLKEVEALLQEAQAERETLERATADTATQLQRLDAFLAKAPSFWQHFLAADRLAQKRLLRQLVQRVDVFRDHVEIFWRIDVGALLEAGDGVVLEWTEARAWDA